MGEGTYAGEGEGARIGMAVEATGVKAVVVEGEVIAEDEVPLTGAV